MDIKKYRKEIDRLDKEIVSLLCKRMKISQKIANLKSFSGEDIYSGSREKEIIAKILKLSEKKDLDTTFMSDLYNRILKESRNVQKKELS